MKDHLRESDLIKYQFDLASKRRMEEISEHLKLCRGCRGGLRRLKTKLSALDLLREETELSEDLIKKTAENARQPVKRPRKYSHLPAWLGAAAAVFLMASLYLVAVLNIENTARLTDRAAKPGDERLEFRGQKKKLPASSIEEAETPAPIVVEGSYEPEMAGVSDRKISKKEITEKPPFAPASAIELVTLPKRENVQLTIYNSADLTLVREKRKLTLKRGWNWLQFMWAGTLIDPTSLNLEPQKHAERIDIEEMVYPAGLKDVGRWLIRSEVSGQVPFEITYFTSGLNWRAFYMGTLSRNQTKMHLQAYVRVDNKSGEDYENARTRLLVGKVHILDRIAELAGRKYPYEKPGKGIRPVREQEVLVLRDVSSVNGWISEERLERKEIIKEGLSEYFLYTIEGTETIPDKWGKRLLSFEKDDIQIQSLYKYDENRYGRQTIRFLSFANDKEHNLGQTPIPNGNVKIYNRADQRGHLSFVGGTDIKYIPVDEDIELNLGPARLVSVEPVLMERKTDNYEIEKTGDKDENEQIVGWDEIETWQIKVTNTNRLPVKVEITRDFGTAYWSLESKIDYKKYDYRRVRYEVTVPVESEKIFNYTVTKYHGKRQDR